ncbi:methyltransferase domain-containing protein [Enterococcus rivorum]|uniref:50S rRNA methyltransferase n=1 Tax=Enterococcus rivorum TaxID=762845 RepID=A0A1E5KZV3_9ENTE|nr:methyltransferase domain-containing protein [Enterococcus rivorum]MBP2099275.1 23S rRNA (guanine745-N1)-methyltransferase [Enterococcus rivorum]OEH83344.1 50S rRNA methyltransferase [Enterococcus rivorum]
MIKKIDSAKAFLENHLEILACPFCHQPFKLENFSLVCSQNHQFDLSKKGTLYFLTHSIQTEYDKKMLFHRGLMIESGMYQPVLDKLATVINLEGTTLDVGCGEGSFLSELSKRGAVGPKIGFDISKEGIYLASSQPIDAFWCIADLTNLPFSDASIDSVLNIFSPSHYNEFNRVLKPEGAVVKIVPEVHYLRELREAFYPNNPEKQEYSNEKVVAKFAQEMEMTHNERVTYTFEIPEARRLDLLEMSPLEWQVDRKVKAEIQANPLTSITIDVRMLKGNRR